MSKLFKNSLDNELGHHEVITSVSPKVSSRTCNVSPIVQSDNNNAFSCKEEYMLAKHAVIEFSKIPKI